MSSQSNGGVGGVICKLLFADNDPGIIIEKNEITVRTQIRSNMIQYFRNSSGSWGLLRLTH